MNCATQGDHHQDAEQAAQHCNKHDPGPLQLVPQEHERGHGRANAEGNRLSRRAGRLDDVVLEDRGRPGSERPGKAPEDRDRQDRDGNRRRHRHADLEEQVERRGTKDDPQHRAQKNRREGQFRELGTRRNVGFEGGIVGVNGHLRTTALIPRTKWASSGQIVAPVATGESNDRIEGLRLTSESRSTMSRSTSIMHWPASIS